ncbi:MAG: hypothetical protein CMK92_04385, partial [Pseudomonas sp.]|nr:hypothetical protein [Pseudomonas sp.]
MKPITVTVYNQDGNQTTYVWNTQKKDHLDIPSESARLSKKTGGSGRAVADDWMADWELDVDFPQNDDSREGSLVIFGGADLDLDFLDDDDDDDSAATEQQLASKIGLPSAPSKIAKVVATKRSIFPEESFSDFRREVEIVTGVPIYAQHLVSVDSSTVPYQVIVNDSNIKISIIEHLEKARSGASSGVSMLENTPIDEYYADILDHEFKIVDREEFTKISQESQHWILVPLDTVMQRTGSELTPTTVDMLWRGFIRIFYPMLNRESMTTWISEPNVTLGDRYPSYSADSLTEKSSSSRQEFLKTLNTPSTYASTTARITGAVKDTRVWSIKKHSHFNYRALFDQVNCGEHNVISVRARIIGPDAKIYSLKRTLELTREITITHKYEEFLEITIKPDRDREQLFMLIICPMGVYTRSRWPEEQRMDFQTITSQVRKITKPVTDKLTGVPPLKHAQFTNTSIALWYGGTDENKNPVMNAGKFAALTEVLADFADAGLLTARDIPSAPGQIDYYAKYGTQARNTNLIARMGLNSWYSRYYSSVVGTRWKMLFRMKKPCKWHHQGDMVKVTVNSLQNDDESNSVVAVVSLAFALATTRYSANKNLSDENDIGNQQKARLLRQADPQLYSLQQWDAKAPIYTKLCQKKHQPQIVSEEEAKKHPKSRIIKFWNFTHDRPEMYLCPDANPYMRFIVGKHPKGWCLPCCKKMSIEASGNVKRQEINNECMTKHKITETKETAPGTGASLGYVVHYAKPPSKFRISRLHPLLDPVLNRTGPEGADGTCMASGKRPYHFGIPQYWPRNADPSIKVKCGRISVLAHSVGVDAPTLLGKILERTPENAPERPVLVRVLTQLTVEGDPEILPSDSKTVLESCELRLGVGTVTLVDDSRGKLFLHTPRHLKDIDTMFPIGRRWCIMLQRAEGVWMPIYMINPDTYRKWGMPSEKIATLLHDRDSDVVSAFSDVVMGSINDLTGDRITLASIKKFVASNPNYDIMVLHTDDPNTAVAVTINYGEDTVYTPIQPTYFDSSEQT